MIKSFDEGIQGEEPSPGTEAPGTPSPATQSPGTDAPATQSPATQSPSTEAPATAPPDERDQTIADLRTKLAEKDAKKEPEKTPSTEPPLSFDDQDFVGDLDLDDLSRDPKEFNALLNKVYQKAFSDAYKSATTRVTGSLPELVHSQVTLFENLRRTSEQFYEENEDLQPFKKVVKTVFEELAAENPDRSYNEIMKDVAPEVRKRLDLPAKKAETKSPTKEPPPKLPTKGGKAGRTENKPSVNPLQAELEEMNKVLGRT